MSEDPAGRSYSRAVGDGSEWVGQVALWSRGVAFAGLLAGGMALLFSEWDFSPPQLYLALVWGGPAVPYLLLSFFIRRFHGRVCSGLMLLAGIHIIATLVIPIVVTRDGQGLIWLYLISLGIAGGSLNLIISAFWARRWIRQPHLTFSTRGFEVVNVAEKPPVMTEHRKL